MIEAMMQGIARAGGVEVLAGRTILEPRQQQPKRPGKIRIVTAKLLAAASSRLCAWSTRLMQPTPRYLTD